MMEKTPVFNFITTVTHPDYMVFAIRIASHLSSVDWENVEGKDKILTKLYHNSQINWSQASVRNAWILGMQRIMTCPDGLRWIVENSKFCTFLLMR